MRIFFIIIYAVSIIGGLVICLLYFIGLALADEAGYSKCYIHSKVEVKIEAKMNCFYEKIAESNSLSIPARFENTKAMDRQRAKPLAEKAKFCNGNPFCKAQLGVRP